MLERPAHRARLALGEREAELTSDVVDAGLPQAGEPQLGLANGLERLRRGPLECGHPGARSVVGEGCVEHGLGAVRLGRAALEQRVQAPCLGEGLVVRCDRIGQRRQLAGGRGKGGERPGQVGLLARRLGDASGQRRLERDGCGEGADDLTRAGGGRAQRLEVGVAQALSRRVTGPA